MSKRPELGKQFYHEMADRLQVVMSVIDNNLQQHPVAKLENNIKDLISESYDNLWKAYQLIETQNKIQ